ncbi:MAG TPA: hypothetical protein VNN08_04215, partial [Thermoanaerobaculia bacterium]|nr:hypothetical protein [Thermoanaerobaculia bacterium]
APINTMVARPRNDTGGQINTGDLRATFALADWGSVIGVGANWTPIPLVGCSDCADGKIGNSGAIPNATLADTTNEIHFDWQLGPADYAPYENGTRARDNCMLVTLTSRTGGVKFVNNSIRRNMDFESASTMTRTAQISIKGLAPIAPDGCDVYLYIETLNMPAKVSQEQPVPGKLQTTSFVQPNGNQPTPAELQTTSFVQPNGNQPTPVELDEMAASGKLTDAQMDQFLPTYRIHVSHDTGNTITVAGTKRPLLRSQGGFGYRVVHQGTLLGWVHKTICVDCTMTEIAPNFYKISKVPNNGVVHVRTTIQAIEPGSSSAQYRFFIDLGPNFPQGNFSHGVDGKFSVNAGIERLLASNNSIEGILGYHRFDTAFVSNPHIWQLSANMKHYFGPGPLHGFLNGGIGAYRFDPGNTTKAGANVGGGLLWDVSPAWGLEAVYNFHWISTSGSSTDFSTFQVGARFRL